MEGQVRTSRAVRRIRTVRCPYCKVDKDRVIDSRSAGDGFVIARHLINAGIKTKISKEIKDGIEIKPLSGVDSGFRISSKDGSAYLDFTGEGISGLLSELLNPRIASLLQEATSGEA